ncbi:sensor histidine kinase [Pseudomonas viridiflava]|uniref:sensor histidine kinase n=1 Tax=Pseudomonas viridiflava TaxID=33069 RepID=UPI000F0468B4|nr:sensor histidine kinase [Pseudomonas viridiflava]MEE4232919.1 sensor histidine kinase [Pseudomonas viridiflava]
MESPPLGFRFAPSILVRLGEELVPNLDQAIIELIRNSYDADAKECTVEIKLDNTNGGTIVISDNGSGMTSEQILNNWLVLGGSSKESTKLTPKGRRTVGDKGLGRLAALRAGSSVEMVTRHEDSPADEAHSLTIEWSKYDNVKVVEEVGLPLEKSTRIEPGTTTTLKGIKRTLGKSETDRLGRSIVLLTSPFSGQGDFKVNLIAPNFPELEARVRDGYLDDAEYVLKATLHADGSGDAKVLDFKGDVLYSANSDEWPAKKPKTPEKYNAPPATFELYSFVFNKNAFAGRGSTIGEVKNWLKVIGGVHFYHRQFRVPPYGDPGHDWLDMNLSRARSPEERPSTNTSVGRVIVDDPDGVLKQKTDRFGFIESDEFFEIRRFAKDALDWLARRRLRDAEARRDLQKQQSGEEPAKARSDLLNTIAQSLPATEKEKAIKAFDRLEQNFQKELRATREDLVLYRSLATAGTTAAVFAHEIGKPIRTIAGNEKTIRRRVKKYCKPDVVSQIEPSLDLIVSGSERLTRFASMQIDFLKREKRRHGAVNINKVIQTLHNLWRPILEDAKIELALTPYKTDDAVIYGAEALVETIITNCLTNSVSAFERSGARTKDRLIKIMVSIEGNTVVIEVEDNGPGINMDINEIWLPGRTTRQEGTGFGLTIVKDSVLDLGGKYSASTVDTSGATFKFVFPLLTNQANI